MIGDDHGVERCPASQLIHWVFTRQVEHVEIEQVLNVACCRALRVVGHMEVDPSPRGF